MQTQPTSWDYPGHIFLGDQTWRRLAGNDVEAWGNMVQGVVQNCCFFGLWLKVAS